MNSITNKNLNLEEAVKLISSGKSITFSGFGHSMTPMAFIREMIRQQKHNMHLIGLGEAWAADILAGSNSLSKVWLSNFMFEGYGRCKNFSRSVENKEIKAEEFSHFGQINRFYAGAIGVPFMPIRSMISSDLEYSSNKKTRKIDCPFTKDTLLAVSAVNPDYAIIHAHRADKKGNVQFFGNSTSIDEQIRASKTVIVTVEEIVSETEINKFSETNTIPSFLIDHVVEVPYGAHPTGMYAYYSEDFEYIDYYMEASKTAQSFHNYLQESVFKINNHWEYLDMVGIKKLSNLKTDPYFGYQLLNY